MSDLLIDFFYIRFVTNPIINSLPDDKILHWSKLEQIADDILKCIQNEKHVP